MRRYDYVLFDKASQVVDDDLFPLLNFIAYSAYPHDRNWPKIGFLCDAYQQ